MLNDLNHDKSTMELSTHKSESMEKASPWFTWKMPSRATLPWINMLLINNFKMAEYTNLWYLYLGLQCKIASDSTMSTLTVTFHQRCQSVHYSQECPTFLSFPLFSSCILHASFSISAKFICPNECNKFRGKYIALHSWCF